MYKLIFVFLGCCVDPGPWSFKIIMGWPKDPQFGSHVFTKCENWHFFTFSENVLKKKTCSSNFHGNSHAIHQVKPSTTNEVWLIFDLGKRSPSWPSISLLLSPKYWKNLIYESLAKAERNDMTYDLKHIRNVSVINKNPPLLKKIQKRTSKNYIEVFVCPRWKIEMVAMEI